jgi:1-acyl-sn-glycerol-3-phosphate acyltransferase
MVVRRTLARALLRLTGWKLVGEMPAKGILVGAPHTSQWDFAAFLLIAWANGVQPKVLVKQSFFKGPLGPILRACGGISLDRANPGETIRQLLKDAAAHPSFLLVLAAEGTRTPVEYWKPGFYRISQQTGLPVALGFVDGPTRTMGMGPSFMPSGDLVADMDLVRAFYADKRGFRPDDRPEPRLREEADGSV